MIVAADPVKIDLWGQSLDDQAVAEALARLPLDVSVLDIGRNRCGALTARSVGRYLSVNRSLLELRLWGNYFGNDGIRDLSSALMQAEHPTLHTISLDGCRLGDEGLAELATTLGRGCTSLRVLSLENNKIGPDGIAALCYSFTSGGASCHLENLSLRRNRIGDGGAVTLANLLALGSASCRVQILDASHNEIGSEGASALGQAMSSNTECHSMSLHGNLISVGGATSMASPIVGNATLAKVTLTRATSVIRVQNVLKGDESSLAGFDHQVDIAFVKVLMAANDREKSKVEKEGSGLSLPPLSAQSGGQGHDEALPMVYSPASARAGMADWSEEGSIVEAVGGAKEQRWPPLGLDFATGTAFMFEDSDMAEEQRRMKAEREEERRRKEEAERRRREQEEAEIAAAAEAAARRAEEARKLKDEMEMRRRREEEERKAREAKEELARQKAAADAEAKARKMAEEAAALEAQAAKERADAEARRIALEEEAAAARALAEAEARAREEEERRRREEEERIAAALPVPWLGKIQVSVTVSSAQHLPKMDVIGLSDPYCVVKLLGMEHKTQVVKKTLSPVWGETFVAELEEGSSYPSNQGVVELCVWDWDRLTHDDKIGGVTVPGERVGEMVSQVRSGSVGTAEEEMSLTLLGEDNKPVRGKDKDEASLSIRICAQRIGGSPSIKPASPPNPPPPSRQPQEKEKEKEGEEGHVKLQQQRGGKQQEKAVLGPERGGNEANVGKPPLPAGKVPSLSLGALAGGGNIDAPPPPPPPTDLPSSGGGTPRSESGTPRGGGKERLKDAAKKVMGKKGSFVGESPGKRKKREKAERAAAKRDAFLKKRGANGSGSASGGESEQSSSVPNTPRGEQSLADDAKPLVGGIVTVSEEEISTSEAVPQTFEVPQDVNGAAGGSGADASPRDVERVPAVEGLSRSSAVDADAASNKGGALKRNSSQRRTGKTSSGISPRRSLPSSGEQSPRDARQESTKFASPHEVPESNSVASNSPEAVTRVGSDGTSSRSSKDGARTRVRYA